MRCQHISARQRQTEAPRGRTASCVRASQHSGLGQSSAFGAQEYSYKSRKDLLETHINEIKAQEQIRIQAYEEALEEALDAEGILHVTENAFSHINASDFAEEYNPEILNALNDPVLEESKTCQARLSKQALSIPILSKEDIRT